MDANASPPANRGTTSAARAGHTASARLPIQSSSFLGAPSLHSMRAMRSEHHDENVPG